MKRFSLLLLLCATFPLLLPADDDTKQVQQALKDQGFYYGDISGTPGEETTQAIRRFQRWYQIVNEAGGHFQSPEDPTPTDWGKIRDAIDDDWTAGGTCRQIIVAEERARPYFAASGQSTKAVRQVCAQSRGVVERQDTISLGKCDQVAIVSGRP